MTKREFGQTWFCGRRAALAVASATWAIGALASSASADVVFDNATAAIYGIGSTAATGHVDATTSSGDSFMGGAFNLAPGTADLTGVTSYFDNITGLVSSPGTTFNAVKATVYIYGTYTPGTPTGTPAFSNLLGTYSQTISGTFAPTASRTSIYSVGGSGSPGISFAPLVLPTGTTQIGLTFNYQGSSDNGKTFSSLTGLTPVISYTNQGGTDGPTVGSDAFNGYLLDRSGEGTGNFTNGGDTTFRQENGQSPTYEGIAVQLDGDIAASPEPTSLLLAGVAAGPLVLRRRRRTTARVA